MKEGKKSDRANKMQHREDEFNNAHKNAVLDSADVDKVANHHK